MWKSTSSAFQKCGTFCVYDFLKGSYWLSKFSNISIFLPSITDVTKKSHALKIFFFFKILLRGSSKLYLETSLRRISKKKFFERVTFFLTSLIFRDKHTFAALCWLWAAITPVKKIVRPKSTTFSETSGRELSHGPILEKFSHQKISRRRVFSKKRRFLEFFVSAPKKFSNCCQSDNFDRRRSAHGSSERSWPVFFEAPARKFIIFKIVGASPLQSQVIQNRVRQNSCFLGNFWEKMVSHGQTVDFRQ